MENTNNPQPETPMTDLLTLDEIEAEIQQIGREIDELGLEIFQDGLLTEYPHGKCVPPVFWEYACGNCPNASNGIPYQTQEEVCFYTELPCAEYVINHICEAQLLMREQSQQPKNSNTLLPTRAEEK